MWEERCSLRAKTSSVQNRSEGVDGIFPVSVGSGVGSRSNVSVVVVVLGFPLWDLILENGPNRFKQLTHRIEGVAERHVVCLCVLGSGSGWGQMFPSSRCNAFWVGPNVEKWCKMPQTAET